MNKSRTGIRLALVGCIAACAILAVITRAARSRGATLTAELATLRAAQGAPTPVPVPAAPSPEAVPSSGTNTDDATRTELAERAALLEAARRIPEVARRELTLRAIKEIKTQHELAPPKARPLPPPMPKNASHFAELLSDPEYLQLVGQRWQVMQGRQTENRLAKAGVPDAVRQQVMQAEFDSYVASLDIQRYMGSSEAERRAAVATRAEVQRENDARIRQLVGDEAFAAYRTPPAPAAPPTSMLASSLEPLATRLSYSNTPLDPVTRARLTEILTSLEPSTGAAYSLPRTSTEFVERARTVLQPSQVAALQELQAEYQAARARSELPKSSELPRTTRRERLEGKP